MSAFGFWLQIKITNCLAKFLMRTTSHLRSRTPKRNGKMKKTKKTKAEVLKIGTISSRGACVHYRPITCDVWVNNNDFFFYFFNLLLWINDTLQMCASGDGCDKIKNKTKEENLLTKWVKTAQCSNYVGQIITWTRKNIF